MNEEQQLIYNELISQYNFTQWQKDEIESGLQKGLEVSWYSKPEFDWSQMGLIRWGLEQGLDVSIYAKEEYNANQMNEIGMGLKRK